MSTPVDEPIRRLADLLRDARCTLVFTGAGISTASGIRDYRGPKGVWKTRRPVMFDDFCGSRSARVEYWEMKSESWESIRDALATPVHRSLVELERAGMLDALVTQNVDGLHRRAGTAPERLVEIHGTDAAVSCLACGDRSDPDPHYESFLATHEPPRCACGGLLKPATISFGQQLEPDDLRRAAEAASRADLVVALGSTLAVHPAADIPLRAALRGARYVIVNRGATDHDALPQLTLRIDGDVQAIFPPAAAAAMRGD